MLYTSRSIADSVSLWHDTVDLQDRISLVNVLSIGMDLSVLVHMFCSALHFKTLFDMLMGEVESFVKEEHMQISGDDPTQEL